MSYNPLIGLGENKEFVVSMINRFGLLGITKSRSTMTQTGYRYNQYIRIGARSEADALKLQKIFGTDYIKKSGYQYIVQVPQRFHILLLSEIMNDLSPVLQKRAEIIIRARQTAWANKDGRNGIPAEAWQEIDRCYDEIKSLY